jgi:hypothetical protein
MRGQCCRRLNVAERLRNRYAYLLYILKDNNARRKAYNLSGLKILDCGRFVQKDKEAWTLRHEFSESSCAVRPIVFYLVSFLQILAEVDL